MQAIIDTGWRYAGKDINRDGDIQAMTETIQNEIDLLACIPTDS